MKKRKLFIMLGLVFLILVNLNFMPISPNNPDFSLKELFQTVKADEEGIPCGPGPFGCPSGMYCDGTVCKWLVDQQTVSCVYGTYCWVGGTYTWLTCNGYKTSCEIDPNGGYSCSYETLCSCDPCE